MSHGSISSDVQVYLRVRPALANESATGQQCIEQKGPTSIVAGHGKTAQEFTFDRVFSKDSSQREIFEAIGKEMTSACLEGFNTTIFAYGQTGAGKTYTVVGGESDGETQSGQSLSEGLIPRVLRDLFSTIENLRQQNEERSDKSESPGGEEVSTSFHCKASICEIYQEQVRDLTTSTSKSDLDRKSTPAHGLQVRESLQRGVYIDGLTMHTIRSAEQAIELFRSGLSNRHVAATSMNEASSRSHSVFTLYVESIERCGGLTRSKHSRFNLIDLAGSERQKSSNAKGTRLKEASSINQSLSALGNVIKALVDIGAGKRRHVHYRDSKLTFLLKDSLGGNSKTAVIANISPNILSLGETLSTLKFAQRAKCIQNVARVNDEVLGQSAAQLREEIRQLKDALAKARKCNISKEGDLKTTLIGSERTIEQDKDISNRESAVCENGFNRDNRNDRLSQNSLSTCKDRALGDSLQREKEMSQQISWQNARLHELGEVCKRLNALKHSQALVIKLQEERLLRNNCKTGNKDDKKNAKGDNVVVLNNRLATLQMQADTSAAQAIEWRVKCQILEEEIRSHKTGAKEAEKSPKAMFAWLGWPSTSLGWTSTTKHPHMELKSLGEDMRRNVDNLATTVETLLEEKETLRQKLHQKESDAVIGQAKFAGVSSSIKSVERKNYDDLQATLKDTERQLSDQEARFKAECHRNEVLSKRLLSEQKRFRAECLALSAQNGGVTKTVSGLKQEVEELKSRAFDAETAQMSSAKIAAAKIEGLEEENEQLAVKMKKMAAESEDRVAVAEKAQQTAEFALQSLRDDMKGLEALNETVILRADEMQLSLQKTESDIIIANENLEKERKMRISAESAFAAAEASVEASFQQITTLQASLRLIQADLESAENECKRLSQEKREAEIQSTVGACLADLTAAVEIQVVQSEAHSWIMHLSSLVDESQDNVEMAESKRRQSLISANQRVARLRAEIAPLKNAVKSAIEDFDNAEVQIEELKVMIKESESALLEKSKGFDVLVQRNAKLEEVILDAKNNRILQKAQKQTIDENICALKNKLAELEGEQKSNKTTLFQKDTEISQLRTAAESLEHLVAAKEATIKELQSSAKEREQVHKADKVALLKNLGTVKEALTALKSEFKKIKKEKAAMGTASSLKDKPAAPSTSKNKRMRRPPLGTVPGNQAVVSVCGKELKGVLKLRRSRRLSGEKNIIDKENTKL